MVSELNEKEQELVYLYRKCSNKKKEHLTNIPQDAGTV